MTAPHPLIAQLIEERHALDLTQRQLSDMAGIPDTTISSFERGRSVPNLDLFEAHAQALGYRIALIHVGEKHCLDCNTTKAVRFFAPDQRSSDGYKTRCGACTAAKAPPVQWGSASGSAQRKQRSSAVASCHAAIAERAERRYATYLKLHASGYTIPEAAKEIGVSLRTVQRFDVRRREEQAAAEKVEAAA